MTIRVLKCAAGIFAVLILTEGLISGQASALEASWGARAGATASDNIDRVEPGSEEAGYLLTAGFSVDVSEMKGRRSMRLSMYGGRENRKAETSLRGEAYRLLLDLNLPWTDTGSVTFSGEMSQQTETPEAGDQIQVRSVATRSRADFLVNRQSSPRTGWQVRLGANEELRSEREATEWTSGLSWTRDLTHTHSLTFNGGVGRGEDDFDGSSWQTSTVRIEMIRRVQQTASSGLRLVWERSDVEEVDGTESQVDRIGAGVFYRVQSRSGWSHASDLGLDRVRSLVGESAVEPRISYRVEGPPGRRTQGLIDLSYAARLQDPGQVETEWVSEGRLLGSLRWDASRKAAITPSISILRADYFGQVTDDRVDEAVTGRLGLTLRPSESWTATLLASAESRDSTDENYRLEERRLELTLAAQFL